MLALSVLVTKGSSNSVIFCIPVGAAFLWIAWKLFSKQSYNDDHEAARWRGEYISCDGKYKYYEYDGVKHKYELTELEKREYKKHH